MVVIRSLVLETKNKNTKFLIIILFQFYWQDIWDSVTTGHKSVPNERHHVSWDLCIVVVLVVGDEGNRRRKSDNESIFRSSFFKFVVFVSEWVIMTTTSFQTFSSPLSLFFSLFIWVWFIIMWVHLILPSRKLPIHGGCRRSWWWVLHLWLTAWDGIDRNRMAGAEK